MTTLTKWCGEEHPLHLYILNVEHKLLQEVSIDDAVRVGKVMLLRALKYEEMLGPLKISECYYEMGLVLVLDSRFSESLSHFVRSKVILE